MLSAVNPAPCFKVQKCMCAECAVENSFEFKGIINGAKAVLMQCQPLLTVFSNTEIKCLNLTFLGYICLHAQELIANRILKVTVAHLQGQNLTLPVSNNVYLVL
jgi:hypothetical protein